MAVYRPIVVDVRMSDYGYWVVTVSASPGRRAEIMIGVTGITRRAAADLALGTLAAVTAPRGGRS